MLTAEEEKWAPIWREAHEIAAKEMPSIESGICKQPGLAALLANFAIKAIKAEQERCAKIADDQAQACSDGATNDGEVWIASRIAKAIRGSR